MFRKNLLFSHLCFKTCSENILGNSDNFFNWIKFFIFWRNKYWQILKRLRITNPTNRSTQVFWKNLSFSYLYLETCQNSENILTKVDVPVITSVPVIVSVYTGDHWDIHFTSKQVFKVYLNLYFRKKNSKRYYRQKFDKAHFCRHGRHRQLLVETIELLYRWLFLRLLIW